MGGFFNTIWRRETSNQSTLKLDIFIDNNLVYASAWTSYDNPKEYTLYASLQNCLFAPSSEYSNLSKEIML